MYIAPPSSLPPSTTNLPPSALHFSMIPGTKLTASLSISGPIWLFHPAGRQCESACRRLLFLFKLLINTFMDDKPAGAGTTLAGSTHRAKHAPISDISKSAFSVMIMALLPPSSSKLLPSRAPTAALTALPIRVEPVADIKGRRVSLAINSPISRSPITRHDTPSSILCF